MGDMMKEENKNEKIIDATNLLNDPDVERILIGTYGKTKSTSELIELYGIPVATCHKKIEFLKDLGLIRVIETVFSPSGKKVEYYTANLDNAYVFYDSGKLKVRFKVVLRMASDFRRRYESSSRTFSETTVDENEMENYDRPKKSLVRI
jgi:hypothetical protein